MTEKELRQHFTERQLKWLDRNATVPQNATEEQVLASFASQLYEAKEFGDSEKDMQHLLDLSAKPKTVYSVKDILRTVEPGTKADSAAVDQFLEDWNKGNISNEAGGRLYFKYGPNAMNRADKVMKQAYADKQQDKPKVGTAKKILGTVFAPRSLESWEKGKEASGKDKALDFAENALMALPFAGWAGLGAKAVRLGKAAKVLGTIGTAPIVPHAMEAMDAKFYKPEENLDRSEYNEADALLGTATNIGAPFVLNRTLGRLGRFAGNKFKKTGSEGLSESTTAVLDQLVKDGAWTKPSKEAVEAVEKFNKENAIKAAQEATVGPETVAHATKAKELQNKASDKRASVQKRRHQIKDAFEEAMSTTSGESESKLSTVLKEQKGMPSLHEEIQEAKVLEIASRKEAEQVTPFQEKLMKAEAKKAQTNKAQDYVEAGFLQKRAEELEASSDGMGKAVYELLQNPKESADIIKFSKDKLSGADVGDLIRYKNPNAAKVLDWGGQSLESWAVNKYGSKRDATPVLGGLSNLLQSVAPGVDIQKEFTDWRGNNMKNAEKAYKKSVASKVIGSLDEATLNDDDIKYLDMIKQNPDVLKGFGEGNKPGFRNWYLLRGADLLRGSELYRPTFEVE